MQLISNAFAETEVYAASMVQGTALGVALVIHQHWNKYPIPSSLISLKHYPKNLNQNHA